jgi:hypothetical protein
MAEPSNNPIIRKIDLGSPAVAQAAIEKARQTKTKLVIWRDGKIVEVDPDEIDLTEKPA